MRMTVKKQALIDADLGTNYCHESSGIKIQQ